VTRIVPIIALVLTAVGLAACGGGGRSSGPPPTAQPVASAPATVAQASAPSKQLHHRARHTARHPRAHRSTSTTQRAASSIPGATALATPIACLRQAGLGRPARSKPGIWSGLDRASGRPVLVDGPYPTPYAAQQSAQSLVGVESAERGGSYVVSAVLRAHLDAQVHRVARCLNPAG
jgi:hypothetical protein